MFNVDENEWEIYWIYIYIYIVHMLLLRKVEIDPSRLLPQVPIEVKEDLTLQVKLVRILDRNEKELRNKKVSLAKVL